MFLPIFGARGGATALAALTAISLGCGFAAGFKFREPAFARLQLRQEQLHAAAAERALRDVVASQAVTASIGQASAARQIEIRTVTAEIVREVPVYVTEKSDVACAIPVGFVRLHDAAATGEPPPTLSNAAATSHDAASDVALSEVASTIAGNYGSCRADQERLSALQTWITAQAAAWMSAN